MSNNELTTGKAASAPFFVGVTGYVNLEQEEAKLLQERLRLLFRFLRNGATPESLQELLKLLGADARETKVVEAYRDALSDWTTIGLGEDTPIVVLTSLAPGVDTIAARLVLDEFADQNFRLLCPLPLPAHVYCCDSRFVRIAEDGQPAAGNLDRQREVLQVLAEIKAIPAGLVDRATGTKELPPELVEALQNVPREQVFAVRTHEADGDAQQRYYAAGEFLTVSAHLLIAVWNGGRESSGTPAVVEARLAGPRTGLLATTSHLPLQHGGPVWHLLANQSDTPGVNLECCAETMGAPLPPLRFLYPYAVAGRDCPGAKIIGPRQARNMELQTERLRLLARIGENLSNFNSRKVPDERDRNKAYRDMLAEPQERKPDFATLLHQKSPDYAEGLRHVSDIRRRSADLTDFYQKQVKRTLARLFWMTLLAAILLHFCSHWHPRHPEVHDENHAEQHHAEPKSGDDVAAHFNPVQLGCGCLALLLAAGAVGHFAWQRSKKLEPHAYDTRAIAEGLRVQFFWNLAGLGTSVTANYMSRHRSELDWIRGVIRATSTPYGRWAEWFAELDSDELRLRALRVVQHAWVRNQLKYFRRASHREHHRLHLWHAFGGVSALAGVLTFLKLIGHEIGPPVAGFVGLVCGGWLALGLVIATACLSCALAAHRALRKGVSERGTFAAIFPELYESIAEVRKAARRAWNRKREGRRDKFLNRAIAWIFVWSSAVGVVALELVGVLVPAHRQSAMTQTNFRRRLLHGTGSFAAHLPLALAVACFGSTACHWVFTAFPTSPWPLTLGIILGGVLLVVGALSVAWAEKNLHSEWAYQYNTMTGLFDAADARLDQQLARLEAITGDDAVSREQRKQMVNRIQNLLLELGQEALDESAEWLLLHRARPLEPVMAG